MELLQLRYFIALAETESVSETAKQLQITSPSLSKAVGRLEAELGVDLFESAGRGIRLSESGKRLYSRLKPALAEIDSAISDETQRDDVGVVIGISTAWTDVLVDFTAKRPDIRLCTNVAPSDRVIKLFATNRYDFWITTTDISRKPELADFFDARVLCDDSMMLAVHRSHPLAQKGTVSLSEIKDENVLFPLGKYNSHDYHLQLCRMAGFEPKNVVMAEPVRRLGMVSRNEGIAFLECIENNGALFRDVVLLKVSDLPFKGSCYICTRKGRKLSPNAQTFLNFALRYYRKD